MLSRKSFSVCLVIIFLIVNTGFGQNLADNWNDFLHYMKIGRLDLAKGYAQAVLDSDPDPVKLLALSEANPQGYAILLRVIKSAPDAELTELSGRVLAIIEQGKFVRRANPKVIIEEIERLSTTDRGRMMAVKRLRNAGEYAVMYMLDAMAEADSKKELSNIIWALPQIGRDAIRPLTAALQTENEAVKAEIIRALGEIGYPQALAYLKYVVEKEDSEQLVRLAEASIKQIDPAGLRLSAAQLLYKLGENYYDHASSLAPIEDTGFGNMWFWDADNRRLYREEVDIAYFHELMAMRACEWALKADAGFGKAIGLWQGAYFKAESAGKNMPGYFGPGHADAMVYATTAGPEYLHQALGRAVKDKDAYVALGVIEALATTAGEKSLLYRIGPAQPLVQALTFDNRAARYSAAIAIAIAGPTREFVESGLVADNLAAALAENAEALDNDADLVNEWVEQSYSVRAAMAMLKLVQTKNDIVNLAGAHVTLVRATKDERSDIQILAGQVLAYFGSPQAQLAIAAMALDDDNNSMVVRQYAFVSLAMSAKLNGSMLDNKTIDTIYSLISSVNTDPGLRSAAASAFGALNLPSHKVKDLILDQAKN